MFCTRCGTRNLDTDQFCRSCNAPLVKPRDSQRQDPYSGSAQPSPPYPTTAGQQPHQQPTQTHQPYPGYQGFPVSQSGYANQLPMNQASASGRAIAAMILSIVALFTCGPFLSIPGMIMGKMEMDAIRQGQAPVAGEAFAKVGFYVGIIVTALFCLGGLVWGILFAIGMSQSTL